MIFNNYRHLFINQIGQAAYFQLRTYFYVFLEQYLVHINIKFGKINMYIYVENHEINSTVIIK